MTDLLIRGGTVVDGTGAPAYRGDVAVTNGKVTDVGTFTGRRAMRMIDARGKVVAPGFIDIHSHSDESMLVNSAMESALHQGVTLVVCGNCGGSSAPVQGLAAEEADKEYARLGVKRTWSHFYEYAADGERKSYGLRVGCIEQRRELVPHKQIWCRSALEWTMELGSIEKRQRE